ncbi:MAG: hypothetical protein V5B38_09290 [Candidatus Accumulibacter propinquus]
MLNHLNLFGGGYLQQAERMVADCWPRLATEPPVERPACGPPARRKAMDIPAANRNNGSDTSGKSSSGHCS